VRRSWGQDRRIRKKADFQSVLGQGKSWAHPLVVLRAYRSGSSPSRAGFVVGRRVGNAVFRNRVRRRLRETVRQVDIIEGWDLVFIARPPAGQADFHQIRQAVYELLRRAGVVQAPLEGQSKKDSG